QIECNLKKCRFEIFKAKLVHAQLKNIKVIDEQLLYYKLRAKLQQCSLRNVASGCRAIASGCRAIVVVAGWPSSTVEKCDLHNAEMNTMTVTMSSNSPATNANTSDGHQPMDDKIKCMKFLKSLLVYAEKNGSERIMNGLSDILRQLLHILPQLPMVDRDVFTIWLAKAFKHFSNMCDPIYLEPLGNMNTPDFIDKVHGLLGSKPQPSLLPFLEKTLPLVKEAFNAGEFVLNGLSSNASVAPPPTSPAQIVPSVNLPNISATPITISRPSFNPQQQQILRPLLQQQHQIAPNNQPPVRGQQQFVFATIQPSTTGGGSTTQNVAANITLGTAPVTLQAVSNNGSTVLTMAPRFYSTTNNARLFPIKNVAVGQVVPMSQVRSSAAFDSATVGTPSGSSPAIAAGASRPSVQQQPQQFQVFATTSQQQAVVRPQFQTANVATATIISQVQQQQQSLNRLQFQQQRIVVPSQSQPQSLRPSSVAAQLNYPLPGTSMLAESPRTTTVQTFRSAAIMQAEPSTSFKQQQFQTPATPEKFKEPDDDINDVAAMGGVNIAEESQKILDATSDILSHESRSCGKEELLLHKGALSSRIRAACSRYLFCNHGKSEL
uniref:Transcription initiation factor TFIID component TAF4 C-terminal domain-containing protein n=1 Tax=Romanomermis culicivorax TaxID=13658 RepID=A0A915KF64_ROMCU